MDGIAFEQVVKRGCGIDIHRDEAVATIGGEGITTETRSFKTFTSSLTELKEWLIENGVTDVAMESPGEYWKPVMNVLEGPELRVWIVNCECPAHQVCSRSQDRQKGQCLDMPTTAGWSSEKELCPTSRTT